MKPISKMTQAEFGALIQSNLRENAIDVVLSGGAAVSVYSKNTYVSKDLDLININAVSRWKLRDLMIGMGFYEEGRYFRHPTRSFLLNFLRDPWL